jgi:hypothetical protein
MKATNPDHKESQKWKVIDAQGRILLQVVPRTKPKSGTIRRGDGREKWDSGI